MLPSRGSEGTRSTFIRFAFRIGVIGLFAAVWPGKDPVSAAATLCAIMAATCLIDARASREPFRGAGLNRWDEALALVCLALLLHVFF